MPLCALWLYGCAWPRTTLFQARARCAGRVGAEAGRARAAPGPRRARQRDSSQLCGGHLLRGAWSVDCIGNDRHRITCRCYIATITAKPGTLLTLFSSGPRCRSHALFCTAVMPRSSSTPYYMATSCHTHTQALWGVASPYEPLDTWSLLNTTALLAALGIPLGDAILPPNPLLTPPPPVPAPPPLNHSAPPAQLAGGSSSNISSSSSSSAGASSTAPLVST